jgi:linoleoyl-CoA desaturase
MKKISFPARGEFNKTLKNRVDQYFSDHNLAKTGNWRMFLKTALVLAWLIVSYLLLVFFSASLVMAIITAFAVAQGFVLVGFNIMHDGNHDSYSKNKKLNRVMGFTLDLIGGSNMLWRQKHNILHHTYTNIDEVDDDLFTGGLLRLSPEQKRCSWHRFQHLYAFPVYSLLTLSWMTFSDFKKFFSGRIGDYSLHKPSVSEATLFFLTKIFYFGYMLVLPMFFHPVLHVLLAFVGIHLVLGFTQVETTVDFAPLNKLAAWYLGGLNFQIEHHLFSKICHIHYPALSKIVVNTCREFSVSYISYPTVRSAVAAHYRFLKMLGKKPAVVYA